MQVRRRTLLHLAGVALAAPLVARAQQLAPTAAPTVLRVSAGRNGFAPPY